MYSDFFLHYGSHFGTHSQCVVMDLGSWTWTHSSHYILTCSPYEGPCGENPVED